jgi:hypothetical protein
MVARCSLPRACLEARPFMMCLLPRGRCTAATHTKLRSEPEKRPRLFPLLADCQSEEMQSFYRLPKIVHASYCAVQRQGNLRSAGRSVLKSVGKPFATLDERTSFLSSSNWAVLVVHAVGQAIGRRSASSVPEMRQDSGDGETTSPREKVGFGRSERTFGRQECEKSVQQVGPASCIRSVSWDGGGGKPVGSSEETLSKR